MNYYEKLLYIREIKEKLIDEYKNAAWNCKESLNFEVGGQAPIL